jgi:hypothetical protein
MAKEYYPWVLHIVYTAYDSTTSLSGGVMVYEISSASQQMIGSTENVSGPRIAGSKVVWSETDATGSVVKMFDLSWIGTSQTAVVIAGPVPPSSDVDIGDRFVVWSEFVSGQSDLIAYDLTLGTPFTVSANASTNERGGATSGAWIVWQARTSGAANAQIEALNVDTSEYRVLVNDGALARLPSIDGDLVAYESNLNGNFDVYVHRLSTGETFAITSAPGDQFLNDVHGSLVAWVDASTGNGDIFVASLTFNIPPVANAGPDQSVHAGTVVTLDGSGSTDPDGHYPLSYAWQIISKPAGSTAALSNPTAVNPSFTADVLGDYTVELIVADSLGLQSAPDTVIISTSNTAPVADAGPDQAVTLLNSTVQSETIDKLIEVIITINNLDPGVFKNSNLVNALTNKINAAIEMINQGLYQEALDKLQNDILGKTNGCAQTGAPDPNDWIKTCAEQDLVYPLIIDAINLLNSLI